MFFMKILLSVDSAKGHSYTYYASILMIITVMAGLALFIYWAIKNNFGKGTLERAHYRANSMPYYVPFAVLFGWLGLSLTASSFAEGLTTRMPDWQQKLAVFSLLIVIEIILAVFILAAAKKYFDGGLKGFGLQTEGLGSDITSAAAMFIAVWPLATGAIYLVLIIGRLIEGPDFQMEQNEGLSIILKNPQWSLRLLMIFFATILTPVFEELIFRGFLQSYLRDIGLGPWRSILGASVVFSVLHPPMHLPALLVLSIAMGYAYEKSGSLWRSIFIHFFFNSVQITFALLT